MPTAYGGNGKPVRLSLKTVASNRIEVDPFPFDVDPLRVQLIRRRVDRTTFADEAAFREAYFRAVPEAIDFALCRR